MIISASYKTDIPAFYGDWFRARRLAGHCYVQNAWNRKNFRVSLQNEDCSGFVFWTRNARPFRDELAHTARTHPFVVQYTVTGFPRWLERSVISTDDACTDISTIAAEYGPDSVVWRYDPILFTDRTSHNWHADNFTHLARSMTGHVSEVVVSFAQIYRKTRRNLDRATNQSTANWRDPELPEKSELLAQLTDIAAACGISLTTCTQPDLDSEIAPAARCIDSIRLSRIATRLGQQPVVARTKGTRPGCLCAEARDIGAYNTCAHGCVYCYAVDDAAAARQAHRTHVTSAENLFPALAANLPPETSRS